MNNSAFYSNLVTQNSSDESEEEINPRLFNRSRIAINNRRNRVATNNQMNTIPDDVDPLSSSTKNPPTSSASTSQSTSSSSGWMSTRKIRSDTDRVRFRVKAKEVLKKKKPKSGKKPTMKFRVGSVVTSVAFGELLPLERGQKRRTRNRLTGKILRAHPETSFEWMVRFSNGHERYCRETQLKFDNNDDVTHTLGKNTSNVLDMSPARSGVIRASKVVTDEKKNRKNILDYLSTNIITQQQHNNTTKAPHNTYSKIVDIFKPAHPWLTSTMLRVHLHRNRTKLEEINKHDTTYTTCIQQTNKRTSCTSSQQSLQSPNESIHNPIPSTIYTHQHQNNIAQLDSSPILTQDTPTPNNPHEDISNTTMNSNTNPIRNLNLSNLDSDISPNESNNESVSNPSVLNPTRNKGGRPIGSTYLKSAADKAINDAAKNEITVAYATEYKHRIDKKFTKQMVFDECFKRTVTKRNLPDDFKYSRGTADTRIKRKHLFGEGNHSPLLHIEHQIVSLLICMSKPKRSLKTSDAIMLINSLIDATDYQTQLIEWKRKHNTFAENDESLGKIGRKYWKGFLKRNEFKIRSKKGKKYDLDRSNWTTYLNFADMYDHIEEVLVHESKIAEYLPEPVWMDENGKEVSEDKAKGCKVKVKFTRPDLAICCDEVGCNISQDGDGAAGGTKYVCHAGDEPSNSSTKRDSHFTCLGLTTFDGDPLMCVILLTGKKRNLMVETGIDTSKDIEVIGDIETYGEYDFFKQFWRRKTLSWWT